MCLLGVRKEGALLEVTNDRVHPTWPEVDTHHMVRLKFYDGLG